MLADVVRTASNLNIRRIRKLPFPGYVLVAEGDKVDPSDVVAESLLPRKIVMIDIAHGLGISSDKVDKCMVHHVGDELEGGDIIAQCEGAFSRLVRTPNGGQFVDLTNGRAVIVAEERVIPLRAGIGGEVIEVIPEFGVVIQTCGSLLQGVWGNNKIGMGVLYYMDVGKDASLQALSDEELDGGQILVKETCLREELLKYALDRGAAGVVLKSMAPELIPFVNDMPIPVIVLGGFGVLALDHVRSDLLKSRVGKIAYVNATNDVDRLRGQRPEVVIPLDEKLMGKELGFQTTIAEGQRVRILAGDYVGRVGEVVEYPESPVRYESGLEYPSVVVQMEDGELVNIPQRAIVIFD